ncbi:unnamed protein product [Cuscuta campestris]|uniref:Uncharacterized protein n=1 Tax=Cuscuta campestris TaxID=132261 RepID=A0A484M9A1_9ASTE|nr:unnamed protein product [Cuscuta campestris]
MTVGCPTGADVKTPVFGPSEGMTGMAEAIFGPSGVTIAAVAAVGPITEVTGADPIVALDPTNVVIRVVCPTEPPNPAETFTTRVSELLPFPPWNRLQHRLPLWSSIRCSWGRTGHESKYTIFFNVWILRPSSSLK